MPQDPIPAVPPQPITCRTFIPANSNTIIVAQTEFNPPAGVTVTNWSDARVAHKDHDRARNGRPSCRNAANITEIIVHETVTRTINSNNAGRPNVQLVLHRDGTFTQHADLVHDLSHANHHNQSSFGFETVNPVLPRIAGAPNNGLPPDLVNFPCIQNTIWASQDHDRNRIRHYVRPTDAQLEAATHLIAWATDTTIGHGMNIPLDWRGRRGFFFLFGRDDNLFRARIPGIYAHGYLLVLYAWLRIDQNFSPEDARAIAFNIAANSIVRRREQPNTRRTPHADLTAILNPP